MLLIYYFSKPSSWIIPWIIQAFVYFRLLRKIGQNGKYALIPFVAEGRLSRIYYKNRRYFFHTLIYTGIFLLGGFYLRYYGRGAMAGIFGFVFIVLALLNYSGFLISLYWKIARSFNKKFFFCLLTVLFPLVFLFILTLRKQTFYGGPSFRRSRFITKPMRVAYYILTEIGFLSIAASLLLGVTYLSIAAYMPRPLVEVILQDKNEQVKEIRGDDQIIDRQATMGEEYARLDSEYITGRDKYFPDHSNDKSVVVIEYIIGSNLEDRLGLASFNINQMIKATEEGSALKFVVEAGGSKRWFEDGIDDSSLGRYVIADGKLNKVETLDNTISMSMPDHLYEFLKWAKDNYQADRYMLIFWDHGGGLSSGYGQDDINKRKDNSSGTLLPNEIAEVLEKLDMKFDLIGYDACLMQNAEIAKSMEPYADYFLASEETENGDGWFYTSAFELLGKDPGISTEDFGKEIISAFDVYNTTMNKGKEQGDTTLSLVDLSRIDPAFKLLMDLYDRQDEAIKADANDYKDIAVAANTSYSFSGNEQIDLISYLDKLAGSDYDDSIISKEEIENIKNYFRAAVVYRNHVSNSGINGIAMTFPYESISSYGDEHTQYKALSMDRAMNFYDDYFSIMAYQNKDKKTEVFGVELPVNNDYTQEEWYVEGFENYVDIPAIIDIPLIEKDNVYAPDLPQSVWDIIIDCKEVYYQKADEGWRYLGIDVAGMLDENDRPLLSTDGYWIHINNQVISYEADDVLTDDSGTIYKGTSKALLNDEKEIILDIEWNPVTDDSDQNITGRVTGYKFVNNDSFFMEKGKQELKPGETITFIFDYYDEEGKLIKSEPYGKKIRVTTMSDLKVEDKPLSTCDLKYGLVMTDAYQRIFATELVESHID
ncbi:MAG: hypothetical protein IK151_08560 [Erysipelotrichaceae bacterium]|nr:hypothetical protein [Erysipelotrichaceae bacterium]